MAEAEAEAAVATRAPQVLEAPLALMECKVPGQVAWGAPVPMAQALTLLLTL